MDEKLIQNTVTDNIFSATCWNDLSFQNNGWYLVRSNDRQLVKDSVDEKQQWSCRSTHSPPTLCVELTALFQHCCLVVKLFSVFVTHTQVFKHARCQPQQLFSQLVLCACVLQFVQISLILTTRKNLGTCSSQQNFIIWTTRSSVTSPTVKHMFFLLPDARWAWSVYRSEVLKNQPDMKHIEPMYWLQQLANEYTRPRWRRP